MNYSTDFKSIRDQISPEEWQARLDLAACYRLLDAEETRSGFPSYKH
jgi:hypothetical protein